MSVIPRNPIECECTDCPWQGRWAETDAGVCPECGAECFDVEDDDEQEEEA